MKKVRKAIAFLLVLTVIVGFWPDRLTAYAGGGDVVVLDVLVDTTLRAEPYAESKSVQSLTAGVPVFAVGSVVNKYGNRWYKVETTSGYAYVYEGKVALHSAHQYDICYEGEESRVNVCRCGAYNIESSSASIIGAPAAALPLPDIAGNLEGVLAGLSALGAAANTALGVAFPYIAIFVVGGCLIYIGINVTGTQVEIWSKETALERFEELDDDKAPYHAAYIRGGGLHIVPMFWDIQTAYNKLRQITPGDPCMTLLAETKLNIYTFDGTDAQKLAEKYGKTGYNYMYGNSKMNPFPEIDQAGDEPIEGYWMHYHIFYSPFGVPTMADKIKTHIFYGLPYGHPNLVVL